jgi:hypothetical protein
VGVPNRPARSAALCRLRPDQPGADRDQLGADPQPQPTAARRSRAAAAGPLLAERDGEAKVTVGKQHRWSSSFRPITPVRSIFFERKR